MDNVNSSDPLLQIMGRRLEDARTHRLTTRMVDGLTIEETLQNCVRAWDNQFTEKYLANADEDDPLIYYPLTSTKTHAAAAHIYDIIVNIIKMPITVGPTPKPELPPYQIKRLAEEMYDEWADGGINVDGIAVAAARYREKGKAEITRLANEAAAAHTTLLRDQFQEGGFDKAQLDALPYFTMFPTAFLRQRRVETSRLEWPESGEGAPRVVTKIISIWEAIHPCDMFASRDSVSTQQGTYFVVREHLTKQAFAEQVGYKSFDAVAVERALAAMDALAENKDAGETASSPVHADVAARGGTGDTMTAVTTPADPAAVPDPMAGMGAQYTVTQFTHFGVLTGKELMQAKGVEQLEPNKWYECEITWQGNERIRTVVYSGVEAQLHQRTVWGASYHSRGASFWGIGGEKILRSQQRKANADYRDWTTNNADSAKPIGAVNYTAVSRFTDKPTDIYGGKVFLIEDDPTRARGSSQNKIVDFIDIPNNGAGYMSSLDKTRAEADEIFGIPSFGHGQSQVGTLGRTFNGMALVYGNALKGLKLALQNWTTGILTPIGVYNYNYNLRHEKDKAIRGDTQVVIKGPEGIVEKELQSSTFSADMQLLLPMVEAQILPLEMVQHMAIDYARMRGLPVDLYAANPLKPGGITPSPTAAPGVPMPQPAASNPAFNQAIGGDA